MFVFGMFLTCRPITPVILDQNYVQLKNQIISAERRILKELGFCVHIKHPHKIIVMYLQVLCLERHANLMQYSWNYMNDSLRTDVFVRYQPETVACACIYLTARKLKLPLPKNPAWYTIFGVRERDIRDVCVRILRLYNRPKPNVEELEKRADELRRKYQDAKLKAKGGSGTNTPNHNNSSPSSDNTTTAKTTGAHNAWGGFISRSGSHVVPAITSEKKSHSRSRSASHSPTNKHHKRSKKHKSRSRSPQPKRKSHKRRSYSRSRSRSNSPHKRKNRERRKSRSLSNDRENRNDSRYIDRYDKYERYKDDRYDEKESRSKKYDRDAGGGDKDRYSRRPKHRDDDKDARDRDRSRDERSKDRRR